MPPKFEFPGKGFHLVANKVAEADFFLGEMKNESRPLEEFRFLFGAFVSAARSVTFVLQAVMSGYPDFETWYGPRQQRLKESKLARFYKDLRNHFQKTGVMPLFHSGFRTNGKLEWVTEFISTPEIEDVPVGDVVSLSEAYFRLLLTILHECYHDYSAYVDPRVIFTVEGLNHLGWSIEDLEESLGFPRGWTDVPWPEDEKLSARLKILSRHRGDELMDAFFEKYEIGDRPTMGNRDAH